MAIMICLRLEQDYEPVCNVWLVVSKESGKQWEELIFLKKEKKNVGVPLYCVGERMHEQ